jgi:hypothetical protein
VKILNEALINRTYVIEREKGKKEEELAYTM